MKKLSIVIPLCLFAFSARAQNADDIIGIYCSIDPFTKECTQCEVFKETDGTYAAKIVWLNNPKAVENLGLTFMHGLVYNEEKQEYHDGRIKYPGRSGTFRTSVHLTDDNKIMKMRGYVGIPLFGVTVKWTREEAIRPQKYE